MGVLYAYVAYLHLRVQRHVLEPLSVGLAVPCLRALGRGGLMVPEGNDPLRRCLILVTSHAVLPVVVCALLVRGMVFVCPCSPLQVRHTH